MNKIAYISGPISGLENGNFQAFKNAEDKLQSEGYVVVNPHEIGKEIYNKWSKIDVKSKEQEEEMWREFMKEDIKYLVICHCVFLLDNWESSRGSTLELLICQKLGIPIYYMKNYEPFDVTFQIGKFDRLPI